MEHQREKGNLSQSNIAEASYIESFFGSYSDFQYDPSKPSGEEYTRLRRLYRWKRGDLEGEKAWSRFRLALVKEFNKLFGTDQHDLLAWQTLCVFVGIPGTFTTCDECVRELKSRHFNIVDLIDARRRGNGVAQLFPTEEALQEYNKRTASYFPCDNPKAGNLLRQLLRRPRENTIKNVPKSPLFPPRPVRNGSSKFPTSTKTEEARSTKKSRMIAESVEFGYE